jgi:hypothetical protein
MLETLGDVVSKSVHCILKYVELILQIITFCDSKNTKDMIQKVDKYIKGFTYPALMMRGIQKAMLTNIQQMIIVVPKFNMT